MQVDAAEALTFIFLTFEALRILKNKTCCCLLFVIYHVWQIEMSCDVTQQEKKKTAKTKKKKREKEQQAAAVTLQTKVERPSFGHAHLAAWRTGERPHGGTASPSVQRRSRSDCIDQRARLSAAILRFTGDEIARIPTAPPHDAPPMPTRRCCQSERRSRRRRELLMFSLCCLFSLFSPPFTGFPQNSLHPRPNPPCL